MLCNQGFQSVLSAMSQYDYKILVICGPSGSGKSTILQHLFQEYPNRFGFSVSHTSRKPRPGEKDGEHYHFTTKEKLLEGIEKGLFLESASFSGNIYGTSLEAVQHVWSSGKVCILDIEIEGVKQVKQKCSDLILVFIKPPSMEELECRLRGRGTETEESLQKRLETAKKEIEYGEEEGSFGIVITNDDIEKAYSIFKSYVTSELSKRGVKLDSD